MESKKCTKCGERKPLDEYYKRPDTRDRLSGHCRECFNKYSKALRKREKLQTNGLRSVYRGMKRRCYEPSTDSFKWYGGRGIKVCEEWLESFDAFFQWATASGHRKGLQIDRIDNDGDYSPDNCRFVTPSENIRNGSGVVLTPDKVRAIRKMLKEGELQSRIAERFNIDRTTVTGINMGTTWADVV